jgi:hypothetical protein
MHIHQVGDAVKGVERDAERYERSTDRWRAVCDHHARRRGSQPDLHGHRCHQHHASARLCSRDVQRGPVREEHEAEYGYGEERAAEDEGDRETCQGEAGNLERWCAPLSKQERRAHRNRRDENRNQDREPKVFAEQHAPAMLSWRSRRDKHPPGTTPLRLHTGR